MTKRKVVGAVFQSIAIILFVGAILVKLVSGILPFFLLMFAISSMYMFGKRLLQRTAEEEQRYDTRPPVIYLRSFKQDKHKIHRPWFWLQIIFSFPWEYIQILPKLTFEEALINILRRIGPVLALGSPEDRFAPLGASRVYVDDWQNKVRELLSKSSLVVVIPMDTPSVVWELNEIGQNPGLQRVVIILPENNNNGRKTMWDNLRDKINYLPKIEENIAAIWFDNEKVAHNIVAKSATVRDRLCALEKKLTTIPSISRQTTLYTGIRYWLKRLTFNILWIVIVPFLLVYSILLLYGTLAAILIAIFVIISINIIYHHLPLARWASTYFTPTPTRTVRSVRRVVLRLIFVALISILLLFRTFVLESFEVANSSMMPNVPIGSTIFISKLDQLVKRGDIVAYTGENNPEPVNFKRVIAKGGDLIDVNGWSAKVNGKQLFECEIGIRQFQLKNEMLGQNQYIESKISMENSGRYKYFIMREKTRDQKGNVFCSQSACLVPDDNYFVMGDWRTNSYDSRQFGFIPKERIVGIVRYVYYEGELRRIKYTDSLGFLMDANLACPATINH